MVLGSGWSKLIHCTGQVEGARRVTVGFGVLFDLGPVLGSAWLSRLGFWGHYECYNLVHSGGSNLSDQHFSQG